MHGIRILIVSCCLLAGASAAEQHRVFFIGHSLLSEVPDVVAGLAAGTDGIAVTFKEQNIPGAPLRWHWGEAQRDTQMEPVFRQRYDRALATGAYDSLVLTDSVPRGGEQLVAESVDYLGRFTDLARQHRPDIEVWYYATWHAITSGTAQASEHDTASPTRHLPWRERLEADLGLWRGIVAQVNQARPDQEPVRVIPVDRALMRLADAVAAGAVPGITDVRSLFIDDIHLGRHGVYFVGLVHLACLLDRSPVGLPTAIRERWGGPYWDRPNWQGRSWPEPAAATAAALQRIAWEAVQVERAGR